MENGLKLAGRPTDHGIKMELKPLYDLGCRFPECECIVPYWAFSQEIRRPYCEKVKHDLELEVRKDQS